MCFGPKGDSLSPCTIESLDSLCRDGMDMPKPPYKGKACNCPNSAFVSIFRCLTVVLMQTFLYPATLTK